VGTPQRVVLIQNQNDTLRELVVFIQNQNDTLEGVGGSERFENLAQVRAALYVGRYRCTR